MDPGIQPQPEIRSRTFGSWATIATGTSCEALLPDTIGAGWWSPRKTTTVSSSAYDLMNVVRALSEYSMDSPYAFLTRVGDGQMSRSEGSCSGMPS